MFGRKRNRDRQRFYLLPGMGGKAFRRKHRVILWWSIAAGLATSAIFAGILYWTARR
jgi:hypothetical protein